MSSCSTIPVDDNPCADNDLSCKDQVIIRKEILEKMSQIYNCKNLSGTESDYKGNVDVYFKIQKSGQIEVHKIVSNDKLSDVFIGCLENAFKTIVYPRLKGSEELLIHQQLRFFRE